MSNNQRWGVLWLAIAIVDGVVACQLDKTMMLAMSIYAGFRAASFLWFDGKWWFQ